MINQIEKAVVIGRSWGDNNLIVVENAATGEVSRFVCNQEVELGVEGILEYNNNVVISFIAVNEEVMA